MKKIITLFTLIICFTNIVEAKTFTTPDGKVFVRFPKGDINVLLHQTVNLGNKGQVTTTMWAVKTANGGYMLQETIGNGDTGTVDSRLNSFYYGMLDGAGGLIKQGGKTLSNNNGFFNGHYGKEFSFITATGVFYTARVWIVDDYHMCDVVIVARQAHVNKIWLGFLDSAAF